MKRNLLIILAAVLCAACLNRAPAERLHFKQNGFSIAPLEEAAKSGTYQALMMYLSFSDGFAPNVNVQSKPFTGTIDELATQSKQQLEQSGLKLISEKKLGPDTYVFECTGSYQSLALHLYVRSVLKAGRVYLVTATAVEKQWASTSAQLKACVDSFELDKGK